jgi:ATP-binding cassette subfamily A (ABC1) protein 3
MQHGYLEEDVRRERDLVCASPTLKDSAPVLIKDLWKAFPPSVGCSRTQKPQVAVCGLTAAIHKGEVFGLLGSNGAGKSTTLGILTSDIAPTSGEAYVNGFDITGTIPGGVVEARKRIGLCPQTDPLLDLMTGRETLRMFARLRGVPTSNVDATVRDLLRKLTLIPHADKTTESYSGGNKRKLSLGIASLVGDGGVLLIDECSSGLDPLARRKMWDLIEDLAVQRSAIITTHSMEEAEALSSRVGIMAHGQFIALGSIQHLKSKYLDGYSIDMSASPGTSEDEIDTVISEIVNKVLPGSHLNERHGRFLTFDMPRMSDLGLGTCFKRLQELKESARSPIESYSLSQCSLEQVFIKLVKKANERRSGEPQHENHEDSMIVNG